MDSIIRVPIGFRFRPTDEELIIHYLKRKVLSLPFPASIIPEFHVFQTNPLHFPGDPRENRYFFCNRKILPITTIVSVRDGSGYWKRTGRQRKIISPAANNRVVGTKRSLAFYHYQGKQKHGHGLMSDWVMDEYCLLAPDEQQQNVLQIGDWFVYCIRRKKRKTKNQYSSRKDESSSLCLSEIIDVSCNNELDQEANSEF
ncbi:hypothetical protein M9H77_37070 [Catharanthus roseus]|uniref:Uncharacterized protein n=1 Tax=Catharanthus roseus TaxID=4058 RepID=A0ACB9ZU08_CATRO|nr:hypothetical protein M9H77_37070 [Catharanthus roseus]